MLFQEILDLGGEGGRGAQVIDLNAVIRKQILRFDGGRIDRTKAIIANFCCPRLRLTGWGMYFLAVSTFTFKR